MEKGVVKKGESGVVLELVNEMKNRHSILMEEMDSAL